MKKLLLAITLCLFSLPAFAQNTTCSDRPASDSSNACANTRFVHGNIPAAIPYGNITGVPANTFLGNPTGSAANASAFTGTTATSMLNVFSPTLKGLAPLSGGGTLNFLRADGSWVSPSSCYSLESFGGSNNGVTDNLTAWNAAISAIGASSGCIKLKAGNYLTSGPVAFGTLACNQHVSIIGQGATASQIIFSAAGNGITVSYTGACGFLANPTIMASNFGIITAVANTAGNAFTVGGNSTGGTPMSFTNITNVRVAGISTNPFAAYWRLSLL